MNKIRVGELLFSGLLISALGAVMDPELNRKELFCSGLNVG